MTGPLQFNNCAKFIEEKGGHQYYDWYVFVDEDEDMLDSIHSVTYFLLDTFPNPVRNVVNRESAFALKSRGWGEFTIGIEVRFKDKHTQDTTYLLRLAKEWTSKCSEIEKILEPKESS